MAETWLKQRMSEVGIATSAELARLLELEGLTHAVSGINHWVNGTRRPRLTDAEVRGGLSRVLQLSESELLVRAGYIGSRKWSKEAQLAAEIIDHLPPDRRNLAVRLLDQLRNN